MKYWTRLTFPLIQRGHSYPLTFRRYYSDGILVIAIVSNTKLSDLYADSESHGVGPLTGRVRSLPT